MTPKPIAFFDVDKTLCDGFTGYYTTLELMREGIIHKRRIVQALFYKTWGRLFKKVDVRMMYRLALGDMAGTHIDHIMAIGYRVFERDVKPLLYTEGLEEVRRCQEQGFTVALLSSAPTMLIRHLETFLGAETSFSNGPVILEGILQKDIQEPLCYDAGKLTVAQHYAQEKNVSLQDCRYYADGYSDLPLLAAVGHPRPVNADKHLEQEAKKRRWPLLNFTHLLGKP